MISQFNEMKEEKDGEQKIKATFTAKQRAYFQIKEVEEEKSRSVPPKQVKPQRINEKDVEGLRCLRLGDKQLGEFNK